MNIDSLTAYVRESTGVELADMTVTELLAFPNIKFKKAGLMLAAQWKEGHLPLKARIFSEFWPAALRREFISAVAPAPADWLPVATVAETLHKSATWVHNHITLGYFRYRRERGRVLIWREDFDAYLEAFVHGTTGYRSVQSELEERFDYGLWRAHSERWRETPEHQRRRAELDALFGVSA